ncbi:hypothetical protein MMC34_000831 [Xylographa carneopallida]|nr:hypothetical protein [Xylographa carneopallida]
MSALRRAGEEAGVAADVPAAEDVSELLWVAARGEVGGRRREGGKLWLGLGPSLALALSTDVLLTGEALVIAICVRLYSLALRALSVLVGPFPCASDPTLQVRRAVVIDMDRALLEAARVVVCFDYAGAGGADLAADMLDVVDGIFGVGASASGVACGPGVGTPDVPAAKDVNGFGK